MSIEGLIRQSAEAGVFLFEKDGGLHFKLSVDEIPPALKAEIIANKAQIIAFLADAPTAASKPVRAALTRVPRDGGYLPLSFAQQRLWFIDQLEQGSPQYNMPAALQVTGEFDEAAAELAFSRIIERHEPLRTVFTEQDDAPVQDIRQTFSFALTRVDLSDLSETKQAKQVLELAGKDSQKVFDLSQDLMLRVTFIKLTKTAEGPQGVLLFNMHHIASDGWSMGLLIKEFIGQYQAACKGQADPLPALDIQYADYGHWQREWLKGEVSKAQIDYWQQQLADVPAVHGLALDYARPAIKTYNGAVVSGPLSVELSERLQQVASANNVTLFMLLHAALSVLLSRHANNIDVVIGTPVANRMQAELEPLIGFFVNTLVLRTEVSEQSFTDYLKHVAEVNLTAQANQDVPFEQLVEHCKVSRSMQHAPLFQIMFGMNTNEASDLSVPGLSFAAVGAQVSVAKFDLDINASVSESGINFAWTYDTALFSQARIETFNDHLHQLLAGIAETPTAMINDLPMLSNQEQNDLSHQLNDTQADVADLMIHQLFEAQAVAHPEHIALVTDGDSLTYQALNQQANQLAHYLRAQGVGADADSGSLVGICLDRSAHMMIALLAILKAGGAYVPLDPAYPQARLQYMLDHTGLKHLLSQKGLTADLELADGVQLTELDSPEYQATSTEMSVQNPQLLPAQSSSNLAYVIFTSGSTGLPKGVMLEHKAVVNMLAGAQAKLGDYQRWLAITTIAFDIAGLELFGPLAQGATVVLASTEQATDPLLLTRLIASHDIDAMQATPVTWQLMIQNQWAGKADMQLLSGGEALPVGLAKDLKERCAKLWHCYGPTEATIWSLVGELTETHLNANQLPLAGPLQNYQHFVLGDHQQILPQGAVGELLIGGDSLARGYFNQPALTAERFIDNPFGSGRLYKTGDLVRYLPVKAGDPGDLVFMGRIDEQVKLRGFRIELGEIAEQIALCDGIVSSVVLLREDEPGNKRLVAYMVCEQAAAEVEEALNEFIAPIRSQLQIHLPDYMIPSAFVVLDALPLTPNGKVNKKALPQPDMALQQADYVPPTSKTERQLCEIWQAVLKIERVGITDNFFEIGGQSILSIMVVNRASKQGIYLTTRQVFLYPTVVELALHSAHQAPDSDTDLDLTGEWAETVPILPAQYRFLNGKNKRPNHFNAAGMFRIPHDYDLDKMRQAIRHLLEVHDALRMKFTETPEGWVQQAEPLVKLPFEVYDLSEFEPDEQYTRQRTLIKATQEGLDISVGRLMRFSLFVFGGGRRAEFMYSCHHLVIDGVSSDLMFKALVDNYSKLINDEPLDPVPEKSSYVEALNQLKILASSKALADEFEYWNREVPTTFKPLPLDHPIIHEKNNFGSMEFAQNYMLGRKETAILLRDMVNEQKVPSVAIILYGMSRVMAAWNDDAPMLVDLMKYGREIIDNKIDLSEVMGWHATNVPLWVDTNGCEDDLDGIRRVTDKLAQMPHGGTHLGLLRYLCDDPEKRAALEAKAHPSILLNYFPATIKADKKPSDKVDDKANDKAKEQTEAVEMPEEAPLLQPVEAELDPYVADENNNGYSFITWMSINDGRLCISVQYSNSMYDRETVDALIHRYLDYYRGLAKRYVELR